MVFVEGGPNPGEDRSIVSMGSFAVGSTAGYLQLLICVRREHKPPSLLSSVLINLVKVQHSSAAGI